MAASGIHNISWYLQYSAGGTGPGAGASSATASGSASAAAPAAAPSPSRVSIDSSIEALAQNLHIFMQALYTALASHDASGLPSASEQAQPYQSSQKGLQGRIESLISALKRQGAARSGTAVSDSADTSLEGLQAAFGRLSQQLSTHNPALPRPFNALAGRSSDLSLHGWLQGLQKNLQHGTTRLSSIGNLIDVVV